MLLQWDSYCGDVFWYIFSFLIFYFSFLLIVLVYNVVLLRRVSRQLRVVHSNVCRSFLTWKIGLWEKSQRPAPSKFVLLYKEKRALISKLRCLNRRVSRSKRICIICRRKDLECFIKKM